jgi:hypothetical protein
MWGTHALTQVVDAAGLEFGSYLRGALGLCSGLVLAANFLEGAVHQSAGKVCAYYICMSSSSYIPKCIFQSWCLLYFLTSQLLNAIVTTLGPEIQADDRTRALITRLCDELQRHPDANVQLAGLLTVEQVFVFAPRHISLSQLLPQLDVR